HHDHAVGVEGGDVGRAPRIARVGRMRVHDLPVGDADEVSAELAGPRLDRLRGRRRRHGFLASRSVFPSRIAWSWRATRPFEPSGPPQRMSQLLRPSPGEPFRRASRYARPLATFSAVFSGIARW